MKPRKVIVTLEATSDIPIRILKSKNLWNTLVDDFDCPDGDITIDQVLADVVQNTK